MLIYFSSDNINSYRTFNIIKLTLDKWEEIKISLLLSIVPVAPIFVIFSGFIAEDVYKP